MTAVSVLPVPRVIPAAARRVLLHREGRQGVVLLVLAAVTFLIGLSTAAFAVPDLWIGWSRQTATAKVGAVELHGDRVRIPYTFDVDGERSYGDADEAYGPRWAELERGQAVVVEYCGFWPLHSRIQGSSGVKGGLAFLAVMFLCMAVGLIVIKRRKSRRAAWRLRSYRDGEAVEGQVIELVFHTVHSMGRTDRWGELSYSYSTRGELHRGSVTAPTTKALEHLNRETITVLYLPETPDIGVPYWP